LTQLAFTTPQVTQQIPGKRRARILAVDDDPGLLRLLTIRLRAENYEVEAVENGVQALAAAARFRPDLVISDLRMDEMDGITLLKELQSRWPGLRVIMLTAHGTIPDAVQATQMGAFGFLTKPVEKHELLTQVEKALKVSGFADSGEEWRAPLITRSALMEERLAQAHMVAGTETLVLISGDGGTGKELLARCMHQASPRRAKPFVVVNCNGLDDDVFDVEVYGRAEAAGLKATRGLWLGAEGGTLLLNDVGQLSQRMQAKLLRALQENMVRPVGSADGVHYNVRIVSTSAEDLQKRVATGDFKEELYYRLNVVHVDLPPLSKRREDISLLVSHFLAELARENGQRKIYAPEAVELLATTDWPGNVRQLANVVRQTWAVAQTPVIPVELIEQALGGTTGKLHSFDSARDEFTRNYLSQILQITGGNVSQAARLAKRNRTDFYKLLSRHQLVPDDFKARQA
jgi:two-component system response regulator GlrR